MKTKILIIILLIAFYNLGCSHEKEEIPTIKKPAVIKDSISISVVGDLMAHMPQIEYAKVSSDSFDFSYSFDYVKKYLSAPDLTFGNFETVTAGKSEQYTGYPMFNAPNSYVTALKEAGFDLLTTANNHSLDRGEKGILKTIQNIKDHNLIYNGTYSSKDDQDSLRIINIKGINVAFLSYTYGTNGNSMPRNKSYLVNLIKPELIKKEILKAKTISDIVLVHLHFGKEYEKLPNTFQKNIVNAAVEAGADIIIGGHPHVMQPAVFIKGNNKLDSVFVAYSMGNFFSNQRDRYTNTGAILNFSIIKEDNKLSITNINYNPVYVYKGRVENKNRYYLLPLNEPRIYDLPFIDKKSKAEMLEAFEDTKINFNTMSNKLYVSPIIDD